MRNALLLESAGRSFVIVIADVPDNLRVLLDCLQVQLHMCMQRRAPFPQATSNVGQKLMLLCCHGPQEKWQQENAWMDAYRAPHQQRHPHSAPANRGRGTAHAHQASPSSAGDSSESDVSSQEALNPERAAPSDRRAHGQHVQRQTQPTGHAELTRQQQRAEESRQGRSRGTRQQQQQQQRQQEEDEEQQQHSRSYYEQQRAAHSKHGRNDGKRQQQQEQQQEEEEDDDQQQHSPSYHQHHQQQRQQQQPVLSEHDEALLQQPFVPLMSEEWPEYAVMSDVEAERRSRDPSPQGYYSDGPTYGTGRGNRGPGGGRWGESPTFKTTIAKPFGFEERAAQRPKSIAAVKLEQDLQLKRMEQEAAHAKR